MRAPAIIAAELEGVMRRATVLLGELIEAQSQPEPKQQGVDIDAVHRLPECQLRYGKHTLNGKPGRRR